MAPMGYGSAISNVLLDSVAVRALEDSIAAARLACRAYRCPILRTAMSAVVLLVRIVEPLWVAVIWVLGIRAVRGWGVGGVVCLVLIALMLAVSGTIL